MFQQKISEEKYDVIETVQNLMQRFSSYTKSMKNGGGSNTKVELNSMNFSVGKDGAGRTVEVKVDVDLVPQRPKTC
jgi:hypothetical protein